MHGHTHAHTHIHVHVCVCVGMSVIAFQLDVHACVCGFSALPSWWYWMVAVGCCPVFSVLGEVQHSSQRSYEEKWPRFWPCPTVVHVLVGVWCCHVLVANPEVKKLAFKFSNRSYVDSTGTCIAYLCHATSERWLYKSSLLHGKMTFVDGQWVVLDSLLRRMRSNSLRMSSAHWILTLS